MMIGNIIDDKEVQDKVGYEIIRYRSGKYPGRCTGSADPGHCKPDEKGCYTTLLPVS